MKITTPVLRGLAAAACLALMLPMAAQAQNIAIVNGKAVPKSRVDALMQQVARSGQQMPPGSDQRIKDETVLREIFAQEAERRGIPASAEYRAQLELARQSILIREMFEDFRKKSGGRMPDDWEIIDMVFEDAEKRGGAPETQREEDADGMTFYLRGMQ